MQKRVQTFSDLVLSQPICKRQKGGVDGEQPVQGHPSGQAALVSEDNGVNDVATEGLEGKSKLKPGAGGLGSMRHSRRVQ